MKRLILILFCFTCLVVQGQDKIEFDLGTGRIWKHKKGLLYQTPAVSFSAGLHIQKLTKGDKAWHVYWRNPTIELITNYQNFGNNHILGHAFGIAPGIIFKVKEWNATALHFHYATGIAYLSKTYNRLENPTNNAIGSHYNNTTRLELSLSRKITHELSLKLGLSFVHFSNGGTTKPNSGINVYGLNIGLSKRFSVDEKTISEIPPFNYPRRWGFNFQGGIGMSEYDLVGGPNFPVYAFSLGGYYRFKKFQRLHVGLEYEYSVASAEFEKATLRPEMAGEKARRTIIYAANELIFGEIRLRFQTGFYTQVFSSYEGKLIYFKVQSSYHPSFLEQGAIKPYIGIMLKTHYAVAEYISLNIGIDL